MFELQNVALFFMTDFYNIKVIIVNISNFY